jgi:predicted NAD-dependent protein-ADP-ribosyltransferase YbiA (DUF1768 family)
MTNPTTTDTADSTPLFFWREFEEPYGFLSQWYDSPFVVEGVIYASTEMWMMVQKAKLFGDEVKLPSYKPTSHNFIVSSDLTYVQYR